MSNGCDKSYRSKTALKNHLKRKHGRTIVKYQRKANKLKE